MTQGIHKQVRVLPPIKRDSLHRRQCCRLPCCKPSRSARCANIDTLGREMILRNESGRSSRLTVGSTQPISSSPPSPSPSVPAVQPRFFFCLLLILCACVSARDLSPLPIVLAAPAPFCAVKLPKRFGSVGLTCGILPYRSKTRSRKLLGLTSLPVTASGCAPREAAEAQSLDLPLMPPRYLTAPHCIGLECLAA